MASHSDTSNLSRSICDSVLHHFVVLLPTLERDDTTGECSFHVPKRNRFVYILHNSDSVYLRFRGNPDDSDKQFPQSLGITRREKIKAGWSVEFPFRVHLHDDSKIADLCQVLVDYS